MNTEHLQTVTDELWLQEQERLRKIQGILSEQLLRDENRVFADTMGISQHNHGEGFLPAYCDTATGASVISRFADGRPAPIHVLDGLPETWVLDRDDQGRVLRARPGIVSGFLRDGHFFTREEAACAVPH